MPRPKKNPNAVVFDFALNPTKDLAKTTLTNYKGALNRLAEFSALDPTKPLIKTKADLLAHPDYVLSLLKENISARLAKSATLAAIFYITGRQEETHPYVKEFRSLYYTEKYPQKSQETTLIESAKDE
jgi:hypothetical protein